MGTVSYITPIVTRTQADVEYARQNQSDLTTHNKGAWNYTDCNRVCNNLKYAAEHMYREGFLTEPYEMTIKLDWTEEDIISYETLNTMIVHNMNNLKSYSRPDLTWYPISSIVNMGYDLANWLERNIDELATQTPMPPDKFTLTVNNGTGSGEYEGNTVVTIQANPAPEGMIFSNWSGNHLENIENANSAITTYKMPYQDIILEANYTDAVPHVLTVATNTSTDTYEMSMGDLKYVEADPAPYGKVFHHWIVEPSEYEDRLYEPAASTYFTMPNEDVSLTAFYVTSGPKQLKVINGTGSGYYDYGTYVSIGSTKPSNGTFTNWTGDVQYLTKAATQEYNSVKIPDKTPITLTAHWSTPATPLVTDVLLTVVNGQIVTSTESDEIITSGTYTQGTQVSIRADSAPDGYVFTGWTLSGGGSISSLFSTTTTVTMSTTATTVTANYRQLQYYTLTINTASGTTVETKEAMESCSANANPAPNGCTFTEWTGDISGNLATAPNISFTMGYGDKTITANYRTLEYHTLKVITASSTTQTEKERYDEFTISANPPADGYTFTEWTGDIDGIDASSSYTSGVMGDSDRTITANYRALENYTLIVSNISGSETFVRAEKSTLSVTADDAPEGQRFHHWELTGKGYVSSTTSKTTTFTFGQGDALLVPVYINIWTITVIDGTIQNNDNVYSSTAVLDEGSTYTIKSRSLKVYEGFGSWGILGEGSIKNVASPTTSFTVGKGETTLTANITEYPDKTLTIYWRDPDSNADTLASQVTYRYGSKISSVVAEIAPNKSTFLTWLGDVDILAPSALASTVSISSLTSDTTLIATYYYPESPEYYALSVYDGYPESGEYPAGSQVEIHAKTPSDGWEFYKWYGDTAYLVNRDLTASDNAVIIPSKALTIYAKFKVIGELPLYRVSVSNGTASAIYYTEGTTQDEEGNIVTAQIPHEVSGVYIDVPAGVEVTLTADPDVVGYTFDYWDGNFEQAEVTDIVKTNNPTVFTSTEHDVNAQARRRELEKYTVYTTNATGPGTAYVGTYTIAGNLQDTDDYHYQFEYWTCVDADGNDCSKSIKDPTAIATEITLTDKDLWIEAVYTTFYKLTVVEGQDNGSGYYCENQTVDTVYANTPTEESRLQFDHWDDPMGIVKNIYDPTPILVMKNTVATITAVFTSKDTNGNSVAITGDDIHDELITRSDSYLVNGIYDVGTIVFDKDGCIGVVTKVDPDESDDTDDYLVEKLFYGGGF